MRRPCPGRAAPGALELHACRNAAPTATKRTTSNVKTKLQEDHQRMAHAARAQRRRRDALRLQRLARARRRGARRVSAWRRHSASSAERVSTSWMPLHSAACRAHSSRRDSRSDSTRVQAKIMAKRDSRRRSRMAAEDQRGVGAAEAEAVGQRDVDLRLGLVRHQVDRRLDRGIVEVDRRRRDLVAHRQHARRSPRPRRPRRAGGRSPTWSTTSTILPAAWPSSRSTAPSSISSPSGVEVPWALM